MPTPSKRLPSVVYPQYSPEGMLLILDDYGVPIEEPRERLRGCRCKVPCLGFRCVSSHHRGTRSSPWCVGGDDAGDLGLQLAGTDDGRCATCSNKLKRNG